MAATIKQVISEVAEKGKLSVTSERKELCGTADTLT